MFESLGHYKILDRIGAGGMGEVYRARDTRLGRTVAIKVLPDDVAADSERRERFLADARASAALSHPNLAAVYEVGEDQGRLFLIEEFVPGETLKAVIAGRPLNPRRAADFAMQIADALAEAHGEGIVHGDIHPGNIFITPKDKAKVLDCGLAAWTTGGRQREAVSTLAPNTGAVAVAATLAYMSPEQARGELVDQRSDIFSLGLVIFEMLTGRRPFNATDLAALVQQVTTLRVPSTSTANRNVPAEFDPIVGKAISKNPDHRYQSAVTLSAELRSLAAILDVRSEVSEAANLPAHGEAPRRSLLPWVLMILVVVALAAVAWLRFR
jgi:serine/threonine protein kinase